MGIEKIYTHSLTHTHTWSCCYCVADEVGSMRRRCAMCGVGRRKVTVLPVLYLSDLLLLLLLLQQMRAMMNN